MLPLPVCCWDWFPVCWLAVIPPFKFRFWKLLKIPGDKKRFGLLKLPGFWSWLVLEIPFAIDDPEPKFENCEFPRFRTAEGSMKFCWKEDPDEHWFRMELLQQMTENSDQWTVGASVQNFRFLLRHLRSWRTKKSCLSVEEFWECLE